MGRCRIRGITCSKQSLTIPKNCINIGNMIPRIVLQNVILSLKRWRKITLILGPRQSGKTTLLMKLKQELAAEGKRVVYLNCDLAEDAAAIDTTSLTVLSKTVMGADYVLVDEAQRLTDPGLTFKIIHDNLPQIQLVATGSSSFELKNRLSDALTGRYVDFKLYPLALAEIAGYQAVGDADRLVDEILLYGAYPEVYLQSQPELKKVLLAKIGESYLFKDILAFARIRHAEAIQNLTQALAYQVGAEVNENELANRIKIDRKTLVSYLDILEQAFVIWRLYPYSRNPRREIGRRYKVYFVDGGMRNMLVGDFNPLVLRSDAGAVWENFLVTERLKQNANAGRLIKAYFWRSYSGAEVDYVELGEGQMAAWEIKSGRGGTLSRGAGAFAHAYRVKVNLVNRENYQDEFLIK